MILVTGATGTVGSQVLASLLPERAGRIRVLTRNPGAVFPTGVEKVVGDLGSSDLSVLLDGVEVVFLLTDGLRIADHDRRLAAAAARAGVQRIVKLSALSVGHGSTDPITSRHRTGEDAIRETGLGWTFLRPTAFMSNALNWASTMASHSVVHAPFANGRAAVVDPADIGAVAAACLTEDGHDQKVYELTGPEPLTPPDQVAILGQVLGRAVGYVEADPADVLHQMTSYGMPADLADAVVELLRASQEPFNSEPRPDTTAVTGRPARSFADWAHAHRTAFLNAPMTGERPLNPMTSTTTANPAERKPTFADETAIRDHYQRMLDSWEHGAEAYAECFTPDATYIIANGKVQRGWQEIVDGHTIIFSAWARNSRLEGRIDSITFLTANVAQLVAYGHIVYKDHRSSEQNKRTVYTITARRDPDGWTFVSYQNTPLGGH